MEKRLLKSRTDRQLCGVCGGLARYLNVDATIVRLAFVVVSLLDGIGVLLYILLCLVMPQEPEAEVGPAALPVQEPAPALEQGEVVQEEQG